MLNQQVNLAWSAESEEASLHTRIITTESEFSALAVQWQQLALLDDESSLFSDWQWNSLWWKHYSQLGELHVVLIFDNSQVEQQLVGIGPFYRHKSKALGLGKLDTLCFIGTGGNTSPDDLNILALPSMRQQVADEMCDYLFDQQFERMMLMDVTQASVFYKTFLSRANAMPGYALTPTTHHRLYADLPAQWSDYRLQISRNTHKQMKRRFNRLASLDNVRFNICQTQDELNIAFDALVRLHVSRWESKAQHTGSFGAEDYQLFHKELMSELLAREQLWLVTLEIDDVIVGVEYSFLYKQTLLFFQTGFDPEYKQISPGHVLMTYMIKEAIERGVKCIDLLKGEYDYKTSYANQEKLSANIGYYAKGLYSVAAKLNDQRLEHIRNRT